MSNNIAVSITADVADLQVKRAIMSAELATARKDLRDFAKEAQTGGLTDDLRTSMLAAGNEAAKLESRLAPVDAQLKRIRSSRVADAQAAAAETDAIDETAAAANGETRAIAANTGAHVSSLAAREGLILVHEALSGNFHRMMGSLTIEAQALAGAERSAAAFKAILSPTGLAVIGTTIALAAGVVAAHQYAEAQAHLLATSIGLGAAAGLTIDQLNAAGAAAARWSGQSIAASTDAAAAFAAAGVRSQATIAALAGDVQIYAALTGEKAADAQKALAQAMQDPVKGAQSLNEQLGILDATQLEQIRTMTAAGDRAGAVNVIMLAFQQRIDDARLAGVAANGAFGSMATHLKDLFHWFGEAADAAERYIGEEAQIAGGGSAAAIEQHAAAQERAATAVQHRAAEQARLNRTSAAGAALAEATPEGKDAARKRELGAQIEQLNTSIAAETRLHGANSDAAQRDRTALADYQRALQSFIPTAEKAHRIAALDAELATAKRGHDKARVADLTRQRALLDVSGEVMSSGAASQRADDAANVAEDRTRAPKGEKGPGLAARWQEELRQQEVASADYFRDQTADELAFWQGKLALAKAGSRDYLDVQGHIYEASKALAHQDYEAHIAALNEKLEADRGSWTREQADIAEKLAYIASKYGEGSKEYQDQLREQERAQREHDKQELAEAERHVRETLQVLKGRFDAQERIAGIAAQSAEATVRDDGAGKPLGEVSAAARIGAINAQLNRQKLADLDAYHAAERAMLDKAIADAAVKYRGDEDQYRALLDAKTKADEDYANRKAELDAQARQRSLQDILAVKQAYHSYVDGIVSASVSGFSGMIQGTRTWRQAVTGVLGSVTQVFEQMLERMLANWIVSHVLMSGSQKAELAGQVAADKAATAAKIGSQVALAGAGGVASMAAAPFPLDLGAPAFGAAMAAAAGSFTVAASFAQGTNELPRDMIAQVHAGERIIPAADNRALMDAIGGGRGGKRSGDMHLTYAPQLNADTPSFRDQLHGHAGDLIAMVRTALRSGALRPA